MNFVQYLKEAPYVLFSGGFGTTLELNGVKLELPLWAAAANVTNFETVRYTHQQFADAGAVVLSANTFRTQHTTFEKAVQHFSYNGHRASNFGKKIVNNYKAAADESTRHAVTAAHHVKMNRELPTLNPLFIAGSFGPIGSTHSAPAQPPNESVLLDQHRKHAEFIVKQKGVDFLLPEAAPTLAEAKAMAQAAAETSAPFILGISIKTDGKLFDGSSIREVLHSTGYTNRIGVAINCSPANVISVALDQLLEYSTGFVGAYANGGGKPAKDGAGWDHDHSDDAIEQFVLSAISWREMDPSRVKIFGGCCGSTPDYIRALSTGLNQHVKEYRPAQQFVGARQLITATA